MQTSTTPASCTSRNCRLCDEPVFNKRHGVCKRHDNSIRVWAGRNGVTFSRAIEIQAEQGEPKQGRRRIEYSRETVRAALGGAKGGGRWTKVFSGKAVEFDHHPHSWGDWSPLPDRSKDPARRAWLKSLPTAGVLGPPRVLASGQELCWPSVQRWTVAVDSTPVERLREARYVISSESTYPEHLKAEWPSRKATATAPDARYVYASRWGDPADRRTRS
jgi:hypothetical protein